MKLAWLRVWRRSVRAIGLSGQPAIAILVMAAGLAFAIPKMNRILHADHEQVEASAVSLRLRSFAGPGEQGRGAGYDR